MHGQKVQRAQLTADAGTENNDDRGVKVTAKKASSPTRAGSDVGERNNGVRLEVFLNAPTTTSMTTTTKSPDGSMATPEQRRRHQSDEQLDIVEYTQIVRRLRSRQFVSESRRRRLQSAQHRLQRLVANTERQTDQSEALTSSDDLGNKNSIEQTPPRQQKAATVDDEICLANNVDTDKSGLVFTFPEPLEVDASSELGAAPQRKASRPLPQLPKPPPPGPQAALALEPLVATRIPEPVLALCFDEVGRRLISAEPTRGVRFRAVTNAGDDLEANGQLDWSLWARAACVLPCGHLLIATSCRVQLLRSDGTLMASSDRYPGIVSLAVHDRSALVLDAWKCRVNVLELPHLRMRSLHPLSRRTINELTRPIAMCSLRDLLAIAQLEDSLLMVEALSGRLRQCVHVSNRSGPKYLASCDIKGLLFVSVFVEHCVHIFKLKGRMLSKVGNFRDPALRPGPLAWLPINGILFCSCSATGDGRCHELRSFALRAADMTNWTPRAIRMRKL